MVSVVPDSINFSAAEEEISQLWNQLNAFHTSLKQSAAANRPRFVFYDGPPFATGLPHYGHILAGTIKDIVPRWAHMSGFHVERRFGWDTHGLPVEYEIDKTYNIKGPDDVMKMGIKAYNDKCRNIVMKYAGEWETIITRVGRWVDFKNDYKTLYPEFMESVWWVFKQLFTKGLVYNGVKVMPYSSACATPISNFESGQNYKDVVDPAVVVSFPLVDEPEVSLLAWTTTPWTLPSNFLLCANATFDYVKIKDKKTGRLFILLESRLDVLYKKPADECKILEKFQGKKLEGRHYKPIFDYFADYGHSVGAFVVATDNYVTADSGTGIVHCAPYFGEDDHRVALKAGIIKKDSRVICPLDSSCRFTEPVSDYVGLHVKEADKSIIKKLKSDGRLIRESTVKHSYPFCWRSDTPLIYRAVPSWFVRVEQFSEKLLEINSGTYWVPDFVKEKRFGNWLRDARDWAISRNRYFGTPIPLWVSDDMEEIVCVGSFAELEQLCGQKITDLHRETVDPITIPSKRPGHPPLRRVTEVFDCWFESGSMPYAQSHYPFENKKLFEENFPANFIAEGVDQTRGWFYTLLVLSSLLFGKPPFKNLICNGLILASDGTKMSKRKQNYPDPMEVVKKYGADALRLYLINSPAVRAENLRFREEGVRDVLKDVCLPWFNAYRFLIQNILIYEQSNPDKKFYFDKRTPVISPNIMDRWILSFSQSLFKFVREEMKAYRLYTVVPRLVKFVDNLTNWYVRMNRKRLKGEFGPEDTRFALDTLFAVQVSMIEIMAPFTPFITEMMYQNLRKVIIDGVELPTDDKKKKSPSPVGDSNPGSNPNLTKLESVHYILHSPVLEQLIDESVERQVQYMQSVVELGRVLRDRRNMPLKYPLPEVIVITNSQETIDDITSLKQFIIDELNVRDVKLSMDKEAYGVELRAEPDIKALGLRLRNESKKVIQAIRNLTDEQLVQYQTDPENFTVEGYRLESGDLRIKYTLAATGLDQNLADKYEADSQGGILVLLNVCADSGMKDEGTAREIINRVQKLRKEAKLVPSDPIKVYYRVANNTNGAAANGGEAPVDLARVCVEFHEYIENSLKADFLELSNGPGDDGNFIIKASNDIKSETIELAIELLASNAAAANHNQNQNNNNKNGSKSVPFVKFQNIQLEQSSGGERLRRTVLLENPVGQRVVSLYGQGWTVSGDQTTPANRYLNIQTCSKYDQSLPKCNVGGDQQSLLNQSTRGTILLESRRTVPPYEARMINSWDELKLNIAVTLNYQTSDIKTLYADSSLSTELTPCSTSEQILETLAGKTVYVSARPYC